MRGWGNEEVTHRGIRWRREVTGRVSWYDEERSGWVRWHPGEDAPPRPPGWDPRPPRPPAAPVKRAPWRSPWRIVPVALAVLAVVIAILQVFVLPAPSAVRQEAAASARLLGRCLEQKGTAFGHPRYSASPVPCSSPKAAVKIVKVLPSTPGSPTCPPGTTGVEIPFAGVAHPHVECAQPLRRSRR